MKVEDYNKAKDITEKIAHLNSLRSAITGKLDYVPGAYCRDERNEIIKKIINLSDDLILKYELELRLKFANL